MTDNLYLSRLDLDPDRPGLYVCKVDEVLTPEQRQSVRRHVSEQLEEFSPGSKVLVLEAPFAGVSRAGAPLDHIQLADALRFAARYLREHNPDDAPAELENAARMFEEYGNGRT